MNTDLKFWYVRFSFCVPQGAEADDSLPKSMMGWLMRRHGLDNVSVTSSGLPFTLDDVAEFTGIPESECTLLGKIICSFSIDREVPSVTTTSILAMFDMATELEVGIEGMNDPAIVIGQIHPRTMLRLEKMEVIPIWGDDG